MLQVPRSALGITASSKGLVAGRLLVHDQRAGGRRQGCLLDFQPLRYKHGCLTTGALCAGITVDCAALGSCGVPIPGDITHVLRDLAFQSDAQLMLVVEKDAVFQVPTTCPAPLTLKQHYLAAHALHFTRLCITAAVGTAAVLR
jgi:DNA topoisomerase VI subunit A